MGYHTASQRGNRFGSSPDTAESCRRRWLPRCSKTSNQLIDFKSSPAAATAVGHRVFEGFGRRADELALPIHGVRHEMALFQLEDSQQVVDPLSITRRTARRNCDPFQASFP